ncbi:MAG: hypothetical protein HYT72_02490 [Candidatus Aenigmarchaeota archaeon]|nr:hypothetical protein [Candidatus Aenigmarchaeota archaeon]
MWNPINFFRKSKREDEIAKTLAGLKAAPGAVGRAGKAAAKTPAAAGIAAAGIAAGTAVAPGPIMAPAYAPSEARQEIIHIAERITAKGLREKKSGEEILHDINNEVEKQFKRQKFDIKWIKDENEYSSLVGQGMNSGAEQVGYYEKNFGRYPGQAVRNLERFGAATSYAAQKTPVIGDILYGKVGPAARMESLPPAVRSAINAARMELQKKANNIYEEKIKPGQTATKKEMNEIGQEIEQGGQLLKKIVERLNELSIKQKVKESSPAGQAEKNKGEEGGSPL